MNEVRGGGLLSVGAHLACDLPAMICRVQQYVGQNVLHGTGPLFALAVLVSDIIGESRGRKLAEISGPKGREFRDLRFALLKGQIRPHWQSLGLFPNSLNHSRSAERIC